MSASPGKWETVVNKKKSQVSKSDVKRAQQKFLDNAGNSKVDAKKPIKETETIYKSLNKSKGENKENLPNDNDKPSDTDKYPSFYPTEFPEGNGEKESTYQKSVGLPKQAKPSQNKKKQNKVSKPEFIELEDKIKKLNLDNLQSLIAEVSEKFPEHPLIWLKETATWLQIHLPGVAEKDIGLMQQPQGFPMSLVPKGIKDCLSELLKKSPRQSIEMLFVYCTTMMHSQLEQGKSTIGLRILIQLIVSSQPEVLQTKMEEVLNGKSKSHEFYLALMWTFSQRLDDLKGGIHIWWNVMFPVLKVRSHCPLAINYIERLLRTYEGEKFTESYLDDEQFLAVLDVIHASKSLLAHSPTLRKRLEDLYPVFTHLYLSDQPDGVVRKPFRTLLGHLTVSDEAIQNEVMKLLVFCLSRNPSCFQIWREMLATHLKETSLFLKYIHSNYDQVRKQLLAGRKYKSKDMIRLTAGEFIVLLGDLNKKGSGSKAGFAECLKTCEALIQEEEETKKSGISIVQIFKYLMIVLLGLVAVDLYRNKGWKGSATSHIAEKYKIDQGAVLVFSYVQSATDVTTKWAKDNVPYYYGKAHYYLEPAMETGWNHTVIASRFVYEHSKPIRLFLNENLPPILEKIDEVFSKFVSVITPFIQRIWDTVIPFLQEHTYWMAKVVSENVPIVVSQITETVNATLTWMYQLNPSFFDSCSIFLTDAWKKISEYAPILCEKTMEYAKMVLSAIVECISNCQSWIQMNLLRSFESSGTASPR